MQTVNHKIYGVGEVVGRANASQITVRFKNGREIVLSIPASFQTGVICAEGSLKDEVEAAIAEKKAREAARLSEMISRVNAEREIAVRPAGRRNVAAVSAETTDPIQLEYERYLISKGYETTTPSGYDSTVYSYSGGITRHVLENEHISWAGLKSNIGDIIKKYDVGGAMEEIGAKSNSTVINALKRFDEFVNA